MPAFIPDDYVPDVHQRLFFYKRLAQAGTDEELDEIRAEMVDRCGDPPDEVDALCQVMAVKVRLRALRIRALEAGPGRLVLTLGEGAALDPFLLAKHVQASARRAPAHPGHEARGPARRRDAAPARRRRRPGPPRAARSATAQAVREAVAAAMPAAPTPAQEAAAGRELLRAAREALRDLAKLARTDA